MTFEPLRILEALNQEKVRYVLIGGMAAVVHGSTLPTADVDVVPARDHDNLERLARALHRLDAKLRTEDEPVTAPLDAPFLRNMPLMLNLVTEFGDLDLTFHPAGPHHGHDGWRDGATLIDLGEHVEVMVAALDDIIASKRAANRPKDMAALPYLESLRDQLT